MMNNVAEMNIREMVEYFASTLPEERQAAFLQRVEEIEKEKVVNAANIDDQN